MLQKALLNKDLKDIAEIESESFFRPWSAASIEGEFYKDYSHVYIYVLDGVTVGFIIFWDLGQEAEIVSVAVRNAYRRQGIAGKMLQFAFDFLSAENWYLEVASANAAAINLYEQQGFKVSGNIKDYYGAGFDAYRMNKHIDGKSKYKMCGRI